MIKRRKGFFRILIIALLLVMAIGFIIPQYFTMPVKGADKNSYHPQSFWYYPWGKSITHKGVDLFAKEGTTVFSSTSGMVMYVGELSRGGKVVVVLGPKWRFHYYAHLKDIHIQSFSIVRSGESIGTVGTTGNAKGKPPHLHYSIFTIAPYPWRIDGAIQGWMKMFFLNPIDYMNN